MHKKLNDILSNKKIFEKIIDETILALERYKTTTHAKILGILFVETFINNNFTKDEYNTLLFSIELMHPTLGINCLKNFYDCKIDLDNEKNEVKKDEIFVKRSNIDYSPLTNTSLLKLPVGGTYFDNPGGASINDLGYKFYRLVISKIINEKII